MHVKTILAATLFAVGSAVAQDGIPPPAADAPAAVQEALGFAALVDAVRTAHRGGATAALDRFRAALRFKPARRDEDSIEVDLSATYLAPRFLRYKVEEGGKVFERGWDARGPWSRVEEKVVNLSDRNYEGEREEVRRQVGLARQLMGFLDPTSIFGGFAADTPVRREKLEVRKGQFADCDVISGIVDKFPLFKPPAETPDPRCGLTLWFDATSHRLTAVRATLVDGEDRPLPQPPEFLLLQDYTMQQGVAIPRALFVYSGGPPRPALEASVVIRAIDLAPDGVTRETMQVAR